MGFAHYFRYSTPYPARHSVRFPVRYATFIACLMLVGAICSVDAQAQNRYVKTFTESFNTFSDREGADRSRPYANNLNNLWLIKPSNPLGTRAIVLRFDSINTQRGRDVVRIFAGESLDSMSLRATISGANPPSAIFVTGSAVTVQFITDASIAGETRRDSLTGWTMTYYAFTNIYTSTEDIVRDREGATRQNSYLPNLDALWLIRPPNARQMLLQFDSLNLEDEYDYVSIIAGIEEPRIVGQFTGSSLPPKIAVNDSLVVVRFRTDRSNSGDDERFPSGWKLRYVSSSRATVIRPETGYLNFGEVNLGRESAVQVLRLSGSSFLDDITIIAPEGFLIASSPMDVFRDTVRITVPKGSTQTSRGQVFIRFNPKTPGYFFDYLTIRSGSTEELVELEALSKPFVFWESTGGPFSGQINALVIAPGNVLLAGTRSGIYRSNSNGAVWLSSNIGLNAQGAQRISNITIGQGRDTIVYANTEAGIYASADTGKTWRAFPNTGLPSLTTATIYAVVQYGGRLLAGTSKGLYVYSGNRWVRSMRGFTTNDLEVRSLAVHDSSIVAGTLNYGVFISTDSATTWKPMNGVNDRTIPKEDFAVSGFTSVRGNLFAIVDNVYEEDEEEYVDYSEVYRTNDNGATWRAEDLKQINDQGWWQIYSVALVNDVLYLGTGNGVARRRFSDTSATVWNFPRDPVSTGLTESTINRLVTNGSMLYAGTLGGVFRSGNQGLTWQSVNAGLTATRTFAMTSVRGTVLAGTDGSGVFRSVDNGATWQQANNGLRGVFITGFVNQANTLYTSVYNDRTPGWANNGVFRSLDNGQSWTLTSKFPRIDSNQLSLSPQPDVYAIGTDDRNRLYAATIIDTINYFYVSTTAGISWIPIAVPLVVTDEAKPNSRAPLDVPIYAIEDAPGEGIYIATYGYGVFWSPNPLASNPQWTSLLFDNDEEYEYYVRCMVTFDGDLYVGTEAGLRYANAARTRLFALDSVVGENAILSLYVSNGMLYAGVSENGVWRSADGTRWEKVNTGFFPEENPDVYALTSDGVNMYAGLDGNAIHRSSLTQTATSSRALVGIPDTYTARPGDTISVSIFQSPSFSQLPELTPERMPRLTGVLRFNASLLEPIDDVTRGQSVVINGERLVNFNDTLKSRLQIQMSRDSSLKTFRFRALLGNSVATPLSLTNLTALETLVLNRRPGLFTLRGLAEAGGTRLFVAESKPIVALAPNPTNSAVTVNLKTFESGMTTITVSNVFGQNVKTILNSEIVAGEYDIRAALGDLPQGVYFVSVQTPTQRVVQQMQLIK